MDFDQHVHAELVRAGFEFSQLCVADGSHDQQDAIGTPGPCFEDLIGVEQEVLSQDRQCAGRARSLEVLRRPLEELDIGEH